jgi:HD-like signal output (HDOD) protein
MPIEQLSQVDSLIAGVDNLPTPPVVFSRINESIANPNTSAYHIASIIAEDPAMSAKILRLSNSAFYGTRMEITSVKQAIITIGLEAIRSLVLSTSVFDAFKINKGLAQFQEDFWRHSLAVGSACRALMRITSTDWIKDSDKVFSAGLLHDIGKLVLVACLPKEFAKLNITDVKTYSFNEKSEKEKLGYTHSDLGTALAQKWNLPGLLQDAIAFHHIPGKSPENNSLATLVYCANLMSHQAFDIEESEEIELSEADIEVFKSMNLKQESVPEYKSMIIDEYAKSQVFMEIAKGL